MTRTSTERTTPSGFSLSPWAMCLVGGLIVMATAVTSSYAGPWTPAEIDTVAWYDAADAGTILTSNAANRVSHWLDKSGNGRHATNAVAANQPVYDAAGLNGLPTVQTEGGSYFLDFGMPVPSTQVVFIVSRPEPVAFVNLFGNTLGNTMLPKCYALGGNADGLVVGGSVNPAGLEFYVHGSTNPVAPKQRNVMYAAVITDNTNGVSNTNGVLLAKFADLPLVATSDFHRIGGNFSSWYARGLQSEIVIVEAPLALADQQKIEGYLAWKWGIQGSLPAYHPFKDERPQPPGGTMIMLKGQP